MIRLIPPLTVVAMGFVILTVGFARPVASQPPSLLPAAAVKSQGVSSCSAVACHHGGGPAGTKGSEYGAWMAVDPHVRAYRVLFDDASKQMHQMLSRTDPELQKLAGSHENPLCLRCHAMGDAVPQAMQSDGVGCERCHGPAEKWKTTHYQRTFDRKTLGFHDLRDNLVVRAEVCMNCHVGDGNQEVNHDLIAAGHPRLRFEYSAYYANYPRHWCDEDVKRHGPDVLVHSYLIGQLVCSRAALDLLTARATEQREAWPEYSEYDCASCHHELQKDGFRRDRGPDDRQVGSLMWGNWYHSLLPALADALPAGDPLRRQQVESALRTLEVEMSKPRPRPVVVQQKTRMALAIVDSWLASSGLQSSRRPSVDRQTLQRQLAMQTPLVDTGWDGATQIYLGLAALYHGQLRLDVPVQLELRPPLLELKRSLVDSIPAGQRPKYDTPSQYDPARIKEKLAEYRKRLD